MFEITKEFSSIADFTMLPIEESKKFFEDKRPFFCETSRDVYDEAVDAFFNCPEEIEAYLTKKLGCPTFIYFGEETTSRGIPWTRVMSLIEHDAVVRGFARNISSKWLGKYNMHRCDTLTPCKHPAFAIFDMDKKWQEKHFSPTGSGQYYMQESTNVGSMQNPRLGSWELVRVSGIEHPINAPKDYKVDPTERVYYGSEYTRYHTSTRIKILPWLHSFKHIPTVEEFLVCLSERRNFVKDLKVEVTTKEGEPLWQVSWRDSIRDTQYSYSGKTLYEAVLQAVFKSI